MGLISFIKNAGDKLFKSEEKREQEKAEVIAGHIKKFGFDTSRIQIKVDDDNHLRVMYAVARPDWKATADPAEGGEGNLVPAEELPRYMQMFVDVLDLDTGELLAEGELPALMWMANDSVWFAYTTLPDDDVGVVRYRVTIE
mgnify:CR=1 FL=1